MKICNICNTEKELSEFYFRKNRKGIKIPRTWCKECEKDRTYKYYLNNKKRILKQYKDKYKESPDKFKEKSFKYYNEHKEKCLDQGRVRRSKWRKDNPGKHCASSAKRRSAKLKRTPKYADLKAIKEFYINCPKGFEVDHIIPLQGKTVSGLHVLENLQYLTKSENCSKGNR